MKALFFNQHGGINNLTYDELCDPVLENNHAIVEVLFSSLNHLDLWVLKGWKGLKLDLPHIGGADIVGKIADIKNFSDFKTNDLVCINPGYLIDGPADEHTLSGEEHLSSRYGIFGESTKGGFSQYIKVPTHSIHKLNNTDNKNLPNICASLLVGLTAYRMLKSRANLEYGKKILIVGSAGGLNSFTIKLAKFLGAQVIALTSTESKEEFSKKIGADFVVNYLKYPSWSKEIKEITDGKGVDIVIDNVGQSTIEQSIRSLKKEGKIITVGNTSGHELKIDNRLIFSKQISIIGSTMGSFRDFETVLSLILNQNITAEISETLPLSQGIKGYQILESGMQSGKIVFNNSI